MSDKIKSEIPKSCKENWLQLNTEEKVRFCTLCQKNVFHFTNESNENLDGICLKYSSNTFASKKVKSTSKLIDKICDFLIHRK